MNTYPNVRFRAVGTIDKFINSISSRVFFKPFFSFFSTQNDIDNLGKQNIEIRQYGTSVEIKSGFLHFFNFNLGLKQDYNTSTFKYEGNQLSNSFVATRVFSNLFFNTSKYSRLELQNEAYHISSSNNIGNTQFWYSNLSFHFDPNNKPWYFKINVHNLLNTKNWGYAAVDELVATSSFTRLQPRYVMLKFFYNFNDSNS